MQERYWNTLTQCKFELCYYNIWFARSVCCSKAVNMITAILSCSSIVAWLITNDHIALWSILVIVLQIVSVINDYLPYHKRINEISSLKTRLVTIYEKMEHDWHKVSTGDITNDEINDLRTQMLRDWDNVESMFLYNDALPKRKKLLKLADEEKNRYFKNAF